MKEARELMDEPDFIHKDAELNEVVEKVKGIENTLIVIDDNEDPVGEIHESSLMKILIPQERIDEEKFIGILGFGFDSSYVAENAADLMTHHEVTVEPDDNTGEIAFLMEKEDLRAIPVKEGDKIIGVVHENRMVEEIEE